MVHTMCDVHKTALAHGKTLALLDDYVRGMIRCALSLRAGRAMDHFRKASRAEIEDRLQIMHGVLPPEAEVFKKMAINLFGGHGRSGVVRRIVLDVCPNGDWRAYEVQYYLRP